MSENTFDRLDDLSHRILAGEVVFFIGSGFSIDSEGNKPERLIRRLIIRFEAITQVLEVINQAEHEDGNGDSANETNTIEKKLKEGLISTFELTEYEKLDGKTHKYEIYDKKNIKVLEKVYFQVNDWMCSAYSILLKEMGKIKDKNRLCEEINRIENELLANNSSDNKRLEEIELNDYLQLKDEEAGKALLLDTMGFDNPEIMCGSPHENDIREVLKSYHGRLRERHHMLAKLAREGLSNPLITTNYDLLLDGAYRLSGFSPKETKDKEPPTKVLYPYFRVIPDAGGFFHYGYGHRTALITKIHGCVFKYRRTKGETGNREKYLPTIVFTFREIQNWREDAWSRDYIRTLLRTRTIVFCGYSGEDPVLHDTFRSVYEEMEKQRAKCVIDDIDTEKNKNKQDTADTRAFFFGSAKKKRFHGMEILRAASKAAGIEGVLDITNHANYLEYQREDNKFPYLDDLMLWLYHLVCRKIQIQCLESGLQQISRHLLGKPCPKVERNRIINGFKVLVDNEKKMAAAWDTKQENHYSLRLITDWTECFHSELLKEYVIAENQTMVQGLDDKIGDRISPYWYYPFTENPEWTAWGAIVEIALRKMVSTWSGKFADWDEGKKRIEAIRGETPALSIQRANEAKTILLEVKLRSDAVTSNANISTAQRENLTWLINQEELPWVKEKYIHTPAAKTIWNWAAKTEENILPGDMNTLDRYFGSKNDE